MALISSGEVGWLATSPFAAESKARDEITGGEPLDVAGGLPPMTGSIDATGREA
jgi:hypothetical protein